MTITGGAPDGVAPEVGSLTSPSGLIYRYTLQSPDRSPTELKIFEDWTVEPQYNSVPGVADDSGFGGGTMQYQVLLDQYRLAGAGLSPQQVESALGANNGNGGGGFYSEGGQFYYVRGLGRLETPDDIGKVVLAVHNGTPVLVKDVGEVVIGPLKRLRGGVEGMGGQDAGTEEADVVGVLHSERKDLEQEFWQYCHTDEHSDRVGDRPLLGVRLRVGGHVRRRVAAGRVGDAAIGRREEPHLRLPAPVVTGELMDEQQRRTGIVAGVRGNEGLAVLLFFGLQDIGGAFVTGRSPRRAASRRRRSRSLASRLPLI